MEVHHHGHIHSKKKWKEYSFQFIMLFVAVFLGSLAEYRLEHIIEHKRTAELSKSLYQELRSDSVSAQKILEGRIFKEECLIYIKKYFRDSSLTVLPKKLYPYMIIGLSMTNYNLFEPKDGMLDQLRNSGALRYFRNVQLQQDIGELSVSINNIRFRNDQEYNFSSLNIRPFMLKHFDYDFHNALTQEGIIPISEAVPNYLSGQNTIHTALKNVQEIDRGYIYNIISHYLVTLRSSRQVQLVPYIKINKNLLQTLRENYDVE